MTEGACVQHVMADLKEHASEEPLHCVLGTGANSKCDQCDAADPENCKIITRNCEIETSYRVSEDKKIEQLCMFLG